MHRTLRNLWFVLAIVLPISAYFLARHFQADRAAIILIELGIAVLLFYSWEFISDRKFRAELRLTDPDMAEELDSQPSLWGWKLLSVFAGILFVLGPPLLVSLIRGENLKDAKFNTGFHFFGMITGLISYLVLYGIYWNWVERRNKPEKKSSASSSSVKPKSDIPDIDMAAALKYLQSRVENSSTPDSSHPLRRNVMFKSGAFNTTEPKDHFINECCFGDDLACWLITQLNTLGIETDSEPGQEDFGWYFTFQAGQGEYDLVIGFRPEDDNGNGDWICTIERRTGLIASMLGARKRNIEPIAMETIHAVLSSASVIDNILWFTDEDLDREENGQPIP